MRSLLIIAGLSLLLSPCGYSQPTQTIRGKVVDDDSQAPLLGANVMILEAGPITGVITDESGSFIIEDVPVGRYTMLVSYVGYKSFIMRDILVGTGKEVFLDVGLKELLVEMEGVSVVANINKDQTINPMAGISARSFTVEETEITYQFATRLANITGKTFEQRKDIFERARKVYRERSNIVHGRKSIETLEPNILKDAFFFARQSLQHILIDDTLMKLYSDPITSDKTKDLDKAIKAQKDYFRALDLRCD